MHHTTSPEHPDPRDGADALAAHTQQHVLVVRPAQQRPLGQLTDGQHRHHGEDHAHQQANVKVTQDAEGSGEDPDEAVCFVDVPQVPQVANLRGRISIFVMFSILYQDGSFAECMLYVQAPC